MRRQLRLQGAQFYASYDPTHQCPNAPARDTGTDTGCAFDFQNKQRCQQRACFGWRKTKTQGERAVKGRGARDSSNPHDAMHIYAAEKTEFLPLLPRKQLALLLPCLPRLFLLCSLSRRGNRCPSPARTSGNEVFLVSLKILS